MLRFFASASVVTALLASSHAFAQWSPVSGSTNDIRNTNTSRVGINMNPWRTARLQVFGSTGEGIYGETTATGSETSAVFGWAVSTTGNNYGVSGRVESVSQGAAGVFAYSAATTGSGIGLLARANSPNGWAVFAAGTSSRSAFEGRVGIGTTGPTANLHVLGTARLDSLPTLTDPNASLGANRLIVADSSGNLSRVGYAVVRGVAYRLPNTIFTTTTTVRTFVVPQNVSSIRVRLWGGGGGSTAIRGGGSGAFIDMPLVVVPGETLTINIGGAGTLGSSIVSGGAGGATTVTAIRNSVVTLLASAGGGGGANIDACPIGPCSLPPGPAHGAGGVPEAPLAPTPFPGVAFGGFGGDNFAFTATPVLTPLVGANIASPGPTSPPIYIYFGFGAGPNNAFATAGFAEIES